MDKIAFLVSVSLITFGFGATTVAAAPGSYECTVNVGTGVPGVGTVGLSAEGNNLGSCTLVDATEQSTVDSVQPADSCSIQADVDGDGLADQTLEEGQDVGDGWTVSAFCDVGAVDAVNTLVLA